MVRQAKAELEELTATDAKINNKSIFSYIEDTWPDHQMSKKQKYC